MLLDGKVDVYLLSSAIFVVAITFLAKSTAVTVVSIGTEAIIHFRRKAVLKDIAIQVQGDFLPYFCQAMKKR